MTLSNHDHLRQNAEARLAALHRGLHRRSRWIALALLLTIAAAVVALLP